MTQRMSSAEGVKQKLGFCLSPGEFGRVLHRKKPATNGTTEMWGFLGGYKLVTVKVGFPETSVCAIISPPIKFSGSILLVQLLQQVKERESRHTTLWKDEF